MAAVKNMANKVEHDFLHLNHPSEAHGTMNYQPTDPDVPRAATPQEQVDDTVDQDLEKRPNLLRVGTATSRYTTQSAVDVDRAVEDFGELNRELSRISRASRASRNNSIRGSKMRIDARDVEKANSSTEESDTEPFDLERILRSNKRMEEESGIADKRIGVLFEDLKVKGMGGGSKLLVKTYPSAFVDFFNIYTPISKLLGFAKKPQEVDILSGFTGLVKPGELVLVLGRPGSGCTTFLKVMANQRQGFTGVEGNVQYGPFPSDVFAQRYRGEAVYNAEDDIHLPSLTVEQTLGFALDVKTPGNTPGGVGKSEFKNSFIDLLLKMFNIEGQRHTVIGNQFIRGVSGGERKRVSIAEMMICGASVNTWDNSTRGLDSSTALDYARSLRIMTNIYSTSTLVSLYQASEAIYSQFDKVLLIDQGRCIYYGSTATARAYFEGIGFAVKPRMTTPDFLTGCTDPYEREYKPDILNPPNTPEKLEAIFKSSAHSKALDQEIADYKYFLKSEENIFQEFEQRIQESKRKTKDVYTVSFSAQVWALVKRQFFLKWQDTFSLSVSYATSIVIAILIGTVWLNQPKTSAGAFTRGGVIFISLLFNCFQAFAELPKTLLGRPLMNKHRAFCFHRPSALWVAQIIVDLFFASIQITCFSLIVYFATDLHRTPGSFFTFVLFILMGYTSITGLFRAIGCISPSFDVAIKSVCIILAFLVVSSGYLIALPNQQKWLSWIFYINPLGLAFASMMTNEFEDLSLACTLQQLIPYGSTYTDSAYQVCTLRGSKAGSVVVAGSDYIAQQFAYYSKDLWRNFGILIALTTAFICANILFGEYIRYGEGGKTVTFYAKETAEKKQLNAALREKREKRLQRLQKSEARNPLERSTTLSSKAAFTWEALCYDVPVKSGQRRLLSNVYGYVKPGQLVALMGASGAGKTTLLDTLASRKNIGVITGDVLVDGVPKGKSFQRNTAYAEQLDLLEPNQTVREALRFSADLRQPISVPREEKYEYVEECLALLELDEIADAIIGSPDAGLDVAQRKRVTIGVELAAKPELLLFLDEPTSGLDSQSAYNICGFLQRLARAGQAILCTIHQPNAALFETFDRLLLLQKGGETIYFGDIGPGCGTLLDYFARNGAVADPTDNPAEFMLEAIGAGSRPSDQDWHKIWEGSAEFERTKEEITAIKEERGGRRVDDSKSLEYATPLWHQIKIVCRRQHMSYWRSPDYTFTRLFTHVVFSLIPGLIFLNLDDSRQSLQYRVFLIFQVTVLPALILAQVEPRYDLARLLYYRESAAKTYKNLPFIVGIVTAELPYGIIAAVAFFLPIYYMPRFNPATDRAGFFLLMVILTEVFSITLGQAMQALTPSSFICVLMNPFILITNGLLSGVTIPGPQMPVFWRDWLYQLVPFNRLIGGTVVNTLQGVVVNCKPEELNPFTAPTGQTCGQYMSAFFAAGGAGYLVNNATSNCEYCAYKYGDQFYEPLGLSFSNRYRDLGIYAAFIGSNLIILLLASRFLNFNKR